MIEHGVVPCDKSVSGGVDTDDTHALDGGVESSLLADGVEGYAIVAAYDVAVHIDYIAAP